MSGTHIGKSIYIATATPATDDAAGFEALTWVEIAGLQIGPQFGITHNNNERPDLKTGFTTGLKGASTGQDSTMTFYEVAGDAGQAALRTAAQASGQGGDISIKVAKGSGAGNSVVAGDPVEYAFGYAHSYVKTQPDNSTHEGFTANFMQNSLGIEGVEPA